MNSTTDFIASVYDTLAEVFNFSTAPPTLFLQMAWPGIPISSTDFKNASGMYDTALAEEVFSDISNIVPVFNKTKFEDSAFNVDDMYQIILQSARPAGTTDPDITNNPMFKMFADALYEYMRMEKGTLNDPNFFYHPSKATPGNWYDEQAAQFWPKIDIKSGDVKPATGTSLFVKNNGLSVVDKGVWKVNTIANYATKFQNALNNRLALQSTNQSTLQAKYVVKKTSPLLATNKAAVSPAPMLGKAATTTSAPLNAKLATTALTLKVNKNFSKDDLLAASFKTELINNLAKEPIQASLPVNALTRHQELLRSAIPKTLGKSLFLNSSLSFKHRMLLDGIAINSIPTTGSSEATNGFSISFNYCRVNIDRPWMNLAVLSMPNWYCYGSNAFLFSNGSATDNPGTFPLLPTSFIVVKNLRITANWSAEDKANINNGVAFGPFDIRNGSLNQNTLEIPGMQIIAFISKVMPPLAPVNSL